MRTRHARGASGLGAELGHVVLDANGPECPGACPNQGCLEAFCSGTALGDSRSTFSLVVTAGHCVYDEENGNGQLSGFATNWR